ncbi:hypothetical protein B0F90DRAFT_1713270 [Multifurca ochricompacta]|uniref:Uncharacterized protein n=1 Tax=Multifurca ochricompacta TaxID=376703 RepID=A0AAD4M5X1_9AGAM|nr:hypothetical protein B0F90DRAFT_1713270 [Multifurca ochricompacta]
MMDVVSGFSVSQGARNLVAQRSVTSLLSRNCLKSCFLHRRPSHLCVRRTATRGQDAILIVSWSSRVNI